MYTCACVSMNICVCIHLCTCAWLVCRSACTHKPVHAGAQLSGNLHVCMLPYFCMPRRTCVSIPTQVCGEVRGVMVMPMLCPARGAQAHVFLLRKEVIDIPLSISRGRLPIPQAQHRAPSGRDGLTLGFFALHHFCVFSMSSDLCLRAG